MANAISNTAASLGLPQVLNQLQGLGVNTNSLGLGGLVAGGGAAVQPGVTGTNAAGTAAGTTAATGSNATTASANGLTMIDAVNPETNQTVRVTRDATGKMTIPAPNKEVRLIVEGKSVLFDAAGNRVSNFTQERRKPVTVNLDNRDGMSSGITNMSRIVAARHERLKAMQEALARDSDETNSIDQLGLQLVTQEAAATQHLSEINKKIYDSVESAIGVWAR